MLTIFIFSKKKFNNAPPPPRTEQQTSVLFLEKKMGKKFIGQDEPKPLRLMTLYEEKETGEALYGREGVCSWWF